MPPSKKGRVFVIGLDGATFDLIDPWAAEGDLPTLSKLMDGGVKGVLRSVIPPLTTPAWVSFLTGKNPSGHGLFSWIKRTGTCGMEPFNRTHVKGEVLGDILSRHGLKVGLVNIPCTYPPTTVNGFMVTGLETPSRESAFTYPEALKEELISRFDYEVERTQKFRVGDESYFVDIVETVERNRGEAVLNLMDEKDWDFFMVVFRGTDILSHSFWRHQDETHPAHDAAMAEEYGRILRDHYKLMDGMIARIWEKLGAEDSLILMSDHGSCGFWRHVYLDNLLKDKGIIRFKKSPRVTLRRWLFHLGITPSNAIRLLSALRLRNLIRRLIPQDRRMAATSKLLLGSAIDWSRTTAFPFGGVGQIYVNLVGREEEGCVRAGEEYDNLIVRIIEALGELREPLNGEPMAGRIYRKDELGADLMDPLVPDLYVEWLEDRYGDFGGIGVNKGLMNDISVSFCGAHSQRGIFLATGPAFKEGAVVDGTGIIDLAPLILHLADLPVPEDMEGAVPVDAFRPEFLEARPIRYESPTEAAGGDSHDFSDEEKNLIEERLRNLGYIS